MFSEEEFGKIFTKVNQTLADDLGKWEVEVKGEPCSSSFEISVIREGNLHGHRSWGWFDEHKLLITHNGGPCDWPLVPKVWDKMIKLAEEVAAELNEELENENNDGK